MSTTTSNFELFKYDTTADAQTAFSITNALNNNWDKLDSNCVRRLSTSAATGSGVRPVYVDASGQVQTINYDLPSTQPLTATTSLSENGYIKFSNGALIVWGITEALGQDVSITVTLPITLLTYNIGLLQRLNATMNFTPSINFVNSTQIFVRNNGSGSNPPSKVMYFILSLST